MVCIETKELFQVWPAWEKRFRDARLRPPRCTSFHKIRGKAELDFRPLPGSRCLRVAGQAYSQTTGLQTILSQWIPFTAAWSLSSKLTGTF